jgi:hypothetical protein
MSKWTEFIKDFARRHNLSYGCAMSDKRCSAEYKQYKINELNIFEKKKSKKVILSEQKSKKVKPILEIPEEQPILKEQKPKKVKPIIDIQNFPPELQVIFNRFLQNSHNSNKSLEDFLKSKYFLTHMLKANLRIIANTFGIKVSKYDDREKLADKILDYTTRIM